MFLNLKVKAIKKYQIKNNRKSIKHQRFQINCIQLLNFVVKRINVGRNLNQLMYRKIVKLFKVFRKNSKVFKFVRNIILIDFLLFGYLDSIMRLPIQTSDGKKKGGIVIKTLFLLIVLKELVCVKHFIARLLGYKRLGYGEDRIKQYKMILPKWINEAEKQIAKNRFITIKQKISLRILQRRMVLLGQLLLKNKK